MTPSSTCFSLVKSMRTNAAFGWARPEWQTILCVGGHPSKAREVCPETCGACVDNCVDSESQFNVEGKRRDCLWLSLRPQLHPELCEREDVGRACPETCDKCDIAI
jgi:hypothetical protein